MLISISAACLLLLISPYWKPDQDSVAYLSMARSFAGGRGMLHLGLRQWHYAPLYSVVISPAFWFSSRPFLLISLVNIATACGLVLGTLCWFRRFSRRGAGLVAALVGVNIGLWDVCREPRSDTLFSALFIWAAVFFAGAVNARTLFRFAGFTALGGLIVVAAVFTRQVGIFLTVGFALAMVIRWLRGDADLPRVLLALIPGIFATCAVGVLIVHDHHAATLDHVAVVVTYTEQYRQENVSMRAQLLDGVRRQTADVGRLLIPGMWGSFAHFGQWLNFNTILYTLFTIPVAIGWWRLARQSADPLLWTVPFYAVMFVVWPFDQGTRFNVPMLPVMWASVWMMLSHWRRQRALILTIVLGLHLITSLFYLVGDDIKVARWNRTIPPMAELARRVNTDEPAVLIGGGSNDILIWRYLLDRPVRRLSNNEASPDETRWVLQLKTFRLRPGFLPVGSCNGMELYRRKP